MRWRLSYRADPAALPLADRHYSRQKPGTPQFVATGSCIVLLTLCRRALWVSLRQKPEYVKHDWPGAWLCSLFRNEGAGLSSTLIGEAVAATRSMWGEPPVGGIVTFVDAAQVRPKRDPGYCFLRAGWRRAGHTKGGLNVLQQIPARMPAPEPPLGAQFDLLARSAA